MAAQHRCPRPSRAALASCRGATVADLLPDGPLRLLLVGINPSLWTAYTGTHFAHPGNRFYPALHQAGITDTLLPRGCVHEPAELAQLTGRGVGITNLVARATARADELDAAELQAGVRRLGALVNERRPPVVAVLGLTAYRAGFAGTDPTARRARPGRQLASFASAEVWVLPNPSGLNAHETVATLAVAYRAVAVAAGVATAGQPG